jgi:hypothetical protein
VLIILGVVRPSYPWLFGNRPQHVYDAYRRRHQPDVFAELERLAAQRDGAPMHGDAALTILTRLVIYTGKDLRDLHFRDLSAYAARRPREEYREPTDAEWAEFRDHFQLRKVALGTCDRPYGTPCQHEHACLTEMILIVWGEVQVPSP